MIKKLMLLSLVILILPFVSANVNWWSWGDVGYQGAGTGVDDILWGSNYPQGNITFSNTTLLVSSDYPPIVVDWNGDFKNEIIVFSGAVIGVYNNELNLIGSVNNGGAFTGQGCIFNFNADSDLELAIMDDTANKVKIYQSSISGIELEHTISLPSGSYTDVYCTAGFGSDDLLMVPTTSTLYVVESGSDEYTTESIGSGGCSSAGVDFQNRGVYMDMDDDGYNEFTTVSSVGDVSTSLFSYDPHLDIMDINSTALIDSGDILGNCEELDLGIGNIGAITGTNEIIILERRNYLGSFKEHLLVTSIFGTEAFRLNTTANNGYMTMPSVSDINNDGANEMCLIKDARFYCYYGAFLQEYNVSFADSNITGSNLRFHTVADYNTNAEFSNVIINQGLYTFDGSSLTKAVDFTSVSFNNEMMPYSTAINNIYYGTSAFTKDLLLVDSDVIWILSRLNPSVCGNNICEADETLMSCYADCFVASNPDYVKIDGVIINPTTAYPWQNNTFTTIKVRVLSNFSNQVSAKAILYYGETFAEDSGWYPYTTSGSYTTINMRANHTVTNGYIKVMGRTSSNENITASQLFGFSVVTEGGISYGSGEAVFGGANATQTEQDLTTDIEKGLKDMGIFTAGSKLLLGITIWLVTIIVVAFYLGKVGVGGSAIGILTLIISLIEIIAFTYLGLFPVWILFLLFMLGALGVFVFIKFIGGAEG